MNEKITLIPSAQEIDLVITKRDPAALSVFLQQPASTIAAAITGALAGGREGAALIAGRLVQGALKGQFLKQAAQEINELIEKGKIPEDYAEKKYGFQTLAELLEFIDQETLDEERFLAIKAMFFAVNTIEVQAGEEIANYQLFKLSKKLSSSQLLILKISYDLYRGKFYPNTQVNSSRADWLKTISERLGHGILTLIKQDEEKLVSYDLLSKWTYPDQSVVDITDARLTDLGVKFCENIERYKNYTNQA